MPPGVCWAGKGHELKAGEEEELVQLMASAGRVSDVPGLGMSQARSSSPGFPGDEKGPEPAELQLHTHPCIPVHPCIPGSSTAPTPSSASTSGTQQHHQQQGQPQEKSQTQPQIPQTPSTARTAPGEAINLASGVPNPAPGVPKTPSTAGTASGEVTNPAPAVPNPAPESSNSINSKDSPRRSPKSHHRIPKHH